MMVYASIVSMGVSETRAPYGAFDMSGRPPVHGRVGARFVEDALRRMGMSLSWTNRVSYSIPCAAR